MKQSLRTTFETNIKYFLVLIIRKLHLYRFLGIIGKTGDLLSILFNYAEYLDILEFTGKSQPFKKREDLWKLVINSTKIENDPIDYLEFGVFRGDSIRWWSLANKNEVSKFFGFDTFTGLPEEWIENPKGFFDVGGNFPQINDIRCTFIRGEFQKSAPRFLSTFQKSRRMVAYIDADLYSAILYMLVTLTPILDKNDLLIIDDVACITHGFRALSTFFSLFPQLKLTVIGYTRHYRQIAFVVRENPYVLHNPAG